MGPIIAEIKKRKGPAKRDPFKLIKLQTRTKKKLLLSHPCKVGAVEV